jgi:hypothetical protein
MLAGRTLYVAVQKMIGARQALHLQVYLLATSSQANSALLDKWNGIEDWKKYLALARALQKR